MKRTKDLRKTSPQELANINKTKTNNKRDKDMQISTANVDDILSELDTDDDPSLNSLAQALRAIVIDIANAVYAQDLRIDELERRLKKVE